MMKSLNDSNILVFALLGPFVVSLVLGILGLPIPTEATVYVFVIWAIIILSTQTNSVRFIFLKNKVATTSYLFLLVIIISVPFSISTIFVYDKMAMFAYLVISKIIILSMLNFRKITLNYDVFLRSLNNFALVILFLYFVFFHLGFTEHLGSRVFLVGSGNPIWFSRFTVDLIFIVLFYSFYKQKITIPAVIILISGVSLLIESGSRGPFLGLLLVSIYCFTKLNRRSNKIIYLLIIVSFAFIAPFLIPKILNFNIYSIYARLDFYQKAINYIINNPWGYGFGSFGLLDSGKDIRSYPHNIILETFVELGLVGLFLLLLSIYYGLKSYSSKNIFFYLFLISLINAQISGDLPGNSNMFVYMYLSVVLCRYKRRQQHEAISLCHGKYTK